MKNTLLLCLGAFVIGVLFTVGLNSTGNVIKVDVVAPAGYTTGQMEQMGALLEGIRK